MKVYVNNNKAIEVSYKTQRQINWEMFRLAGLASAAENPFLTEQEEATVKRIAGKGKNRALKKRIVNRRRFRDFGIYERLP
jgi:hypothetical protein